MELIHNGKNLEVKRLTHQQENDQVQFLKTEIVTEAKKQMFGLPLELAKYAWSEARKEAAEIEIGTERYFDECIKLRGLANALFLTLNGQARDYTLLHALNALEGNFDALAVSILTDVMGFKPKEAKPETEDQPDQPK